MKGVDSVKVVIADREYQKECKSTQRILNIAINKLKFRISTYTDKQVNIDTLVGDNVLKHDIINGLYVYKCSVNRNQIRLLYTYKDGKLIIISHYQKKQPTTEYIDYFEKISKTVRV